MYLILHGRNGSSGKKMMKITIFASIYPPPFIGGAEGVLEDLTLYLLHNDFEFFGGTFAQLEAYLLRKE